VTPERIADYELVEYLAAGGMADLYLARSPRREGPVVLKTIQQKYVEHTRVVKMFVDEGRIAKALDHPNIVRIYDVGADRGAYYIVMEFIAGRDLLAIARRGIEAGRFLPMHIAVAIVAQVATGLAYAHEKHDEHGLSLQVVHCDISPGNVVVSFGGTAKIVDFGIARAAIQLRAEDHTVVGKYNYMAPEQIRGEPLDERADLFSLGVILYELTVGRRLFRGTPDDVKRRVLSGDIIPPREIDPDLPEALERIILRALALDPNDRYPSAREMRADLRALLVADGRPAGKREIAEYLRDVFVPPTRPAAIKDMIEGDEAFARDMGEADDELALDMPIPGLNEVIADPEDADLPDLPDLPAPTPAEAAPQEAAMTATIIAPEPEDATVEDATVEDATVVDVPVAKDREPDTSPEAAIPTVVAPTPVSVPDERNDERNDGEITKPEPKVSEAEPAPVATPFKERRMQPRRQPFNWAMPEPKPEARRPGPGNGLRHEVVVAIVLIVVAAFVYLALRM
jgi:serine/threonine protein kinase